MTNIEAAKEILALCDWDFEQEAISGSGFKSYTVKDEAVASIEGMRAFRLPRNQFQNTQMAAEYLARRWGAWAVDLASQLHTIMENPDKIARLYALSLLFPIAEGGQ